MNADPRTGAIDMPEESAQPSEAVADVDEAVGPARVRGLLGEWVRGKDRSGARKGQAAKARAKRRRKHKQR